MKTKMKALALALCAVMLVATTVFATVAYLTSTTETVTNTFTVGNVVITLDEADVNIDGKPLDANGNVVEDVEDAKRDTSNSYKLMPGHNYTKDPTVHVEANSEDCYVFVEVVNGISDIEVATGNGDTIAEQMAAKGWTNVSGNIFVYNKDASGKTVVTTSTEITDLVVFDDFTLKTDLEYIDLKAVVDADTLITIKAYAIQADGFEDDAAATVWAALSGQINNG